jgi:hypothetical protein
MTGLAGSSVTVVDVPRQAFASPPKHRLCRACGYTTYPRAVSEPGNPWQVKWEPAARCDNCGSVVEVADLNSLPSPEGLRGSTV